MINRLVSFLFSFSLVIALWLSPAQAQQEPVWIQIEAQPNLNAAQERLRDYSASLDDVNGFTMAGGWYAIALGPYARPDAEAALRSLRAQRQIPRDSYIAFSRAYGRQIWPIGSDSLNTASVAAPVVEAETVDTQALAAALPDESPAEARRSEAALTRDERKELQTMLQWAGYYGSAIDGAFGRGTRRSMGDWQADNGFEPTGILTTAQRAELKRQFNAVLEGLDIQTVADLDTGIEMDLPLGVVAFNNYEAPFAHFNATGDIPAKVLLISQAGDQKTLFGLYDIMQTLEIVPLDGPRNREKNSFVLVGSNDRVISHTQAWLKDGEIKGFTLVWPANDEERRARLLGIMQESFTRLDGVLSPAAGGDAVQSIDLLAGLQIRKPRLSRSGFFVDGRGTVVTAAEAIAGCTRITIEGEVEAEVLGVDEAFGVAVLKPAQQLAPGSIADLQLTNPRLQSDVAVSGFSYGGALGAPTLTFGALADVTGLQGEEELTRLALATLPGDVGGPVFDAGGAVLGMLLPREKGARQLPEDVQFALDAAPIGRFLQNLGVGPNATEALGTIAPEDLTNKAGAMTVLVNCWD